MRACIRGVLQGGRYRALPRLGGEEEPMSKGGLSLKHFDTEQLPEHMTYAARLRTAAAKAISEMDMQEIIQEAVKEAKAGNDKARRFLFDAVLGARQPIHLTQVNHYHSDEEPKANGKRRISSAVVSESEIEHVASTIVKARQLGNLLSIVRTRGRTHVMVIANELGVSEKDVRNEARTSAELSLDGDFVKVRERSR